MVPQMISAYVRLCDSSYHSLHNPLHRSTSEKNLCLLTLTQIETVKMGGLEMFKQRVQRPSQLPRSEIWRPWLEESSAHCSNSDSESVNYPCTHTNCDKIFRRESERRRHSETVHERSSENCQYCQQQFTRKDNLTRHIKMKHRNSTEDVPRCTFCRKKLSRQDAVQRHMAGCSQNPMKVECKNLRSNYHCPFTPRSVGVWEREN